MSSQKSSDLCKDCGLPRDAHFVRHGFMEPDPNPVMLSNEVIEEVAEDRFDFAPLSEADIAWLVDTTRYDRTAGDVVRNMARELRASRAALREWHDASDKGDLSRILPAEQQLRALVAHVGGGGK